MRTWVRHSLNAGALTAGALLVTSGAAQASPLATSTDNTGIGNGTQAVLPIQAPINICGNAAAVGGAALAVCEGGSAAALNPEWTFAHYLAGSGADLVSSGNHGIANGTQAYAPIQVPVNVCGNAVSVLGTAAAGCEGGADADHGDQPDKPGHGKHDKKPDQPGYGKYPRSGHDKPGADATLVSSDNVGLLNGTQLLAPIQLPINVCGNAIGVLGHARAGCEGGAEASH